MAADVVGLNVLNTGQLDSVENISALELSSELQRLMLRMKGSFMSEDGRGVDYNALKTSELFQTYLARTKLLQEVNITTFVTREKIAFFLTYKYVYNALTIHGLVMCGEKIPNSVLEISNFWRVTAYNIGSQVFSLDDIEHGILRGNQPHPASKQALFLQGDNRLQHSLSKEDVDPRIHFALVCGAKSCPPINVYNAKNLEYGLMAAAKNFCEQEVDISNNEVTLSKIFAWYRGDFGSTDTELLRKISQYLEGRKKEKLASIIQSIENGESIKIKYSEYNWSINKSNL